MNAEQFAGLMIPRYVINRMCGWRRLGPNIESFYGLAPVGAQCVPEYSVVVAEQDGGQMLMQLLDIFGPPPSAYLQAARMLS
jgi:hypothetical protein